MTVEINPNLAMSLTRQFGITIMNSEAEKVVQMLKFIHRQGFQNGVAIENEACADLAETYFDPMWKEHNQAAKDICEAIRSRMTRP